MPDGNAVKKMIEGFLQSGLSAPEAAKLLIEAEKQARELRRRAELQQFRSGLGFRNFLAFVILVFIFIMIAGRA